MGKGFLSSTYKEIKTKLSLSTLSTSGNGQTCSSIFLQLTQAYPLKSKRTALSTSLRQKLEIQLNNPIELLKLAKEITDELNIEQQLWLIDFQQNRAWIKEKNSNIVIQLEELRKQLLKFVQPRLAWEVTLLEINFLN